MAFEDSISDISILQLRRALLCCIQVPLESGQLEDLVALFEEQGSTVNQKLKQLIGQTISTRLESWKEAASLNRISLPKLQDFDWSLNFQRASSEARTLPVFFCISSSRVRFLFLTFLNVFLLSLFSFLSTDC
jgi:hypothetical protein